MGKTLSKVLGFGLAAAMVLGSTTAVMANESTTYTAYPQGTLENVAAGKPVRVSNSYKVLTGTDAGSSIRTGKYLTDGVNGTWWESDKRLGEYVAGEWAMIDLGIPYNIYKLELAGIEANEEGRKNYAIYGTNTYDFLHGTLDGVPSHYELLMERGETPFSNDTVDSVELNGKAYRYIIIKKTAAEAAKFSELRVYGIEPKLIDVTPSVDNITHNGTPMYTPFASIVDGAHTSFAFIMRPQDSRLEIDFDLGDEYYVKRVELWGRQEGADGNDGAWKARRDISLYATNDLGEDGREIGALGMETSMIMLDGETTNMNTKNGDYAAGGNTIIYDNDATEATRYVKLKWNSDQDALSMADVRIWAEDKKATDITIENVAEGIKATVESDSYSLDLGEFYNIKKIDVVPKDGTTLSNFKVVGTALVRDEAVLAGEPGAISAETAYDTKVQNISRYVKFKGEDAANVAAIKVWAEKDKTYDNAALGKEGYAPGQGQALTDGDDNGIAFGNLNSDVTSADKFSIDLGAPKKIEGYTAIARGGMGPDANERSRFVFWGANNPDFSDAVKLDIKDSRPFTADGGVTRLINNDTKYRYVAVTGKASDVHLLGGWYNGQNVAGYEGASQKVWTELMVYTETADAVNIANDPDNGFFDGDTDLYGELEETEITLDRYYPLSLVTIVPESATTADVKIYGKNSESEDYTEIGTIAAGATETELNGDAYKYIKVSTSEPQAISEIGICTPKKYVNKDLVTESYTFNNEKDGTGSVITDLTPIVLGAKAEIRNLGNESKNAVIILGLYNENNVLVKVEVSESKAIAPNSVETISTGLDNPGNLRAGSQLKAFVWESLQTINPYSESATLN